MVVDFANVMKDENHVSRPEEEEPLHHSAVSIGCTIKSNICLHSIGDQVGNNMVVRKKHFSSPIEEAGGIFAPKEMELTTQLQELQTRPKSSKMSLQVLKRC